MNAKLFKKLNEQIEINKIKEDSDEKVLSEAERAKIEKAVLFGNAVNETADLLAFAENKN